jgi:hypothetical protein
MILKRKPFISCRAAGQMEERIKIMKEKKLTTWGYAIKDIDNDMLFLYTIRSNRKDAWNKFCKPESRRDYQKHGLKCVRVDVKET